MPTAVRTSNRSRDAFRPFAAATVCSLLLACGGFMEGAREHTYPPSFNYIEDSELQAAMWQLAAGVATLESTLSPETVITEQDRLTVIETLDSMDAAMASLGPDGWPSNHPRLTRNAIGFREQLAIAKRAAQLNPPSFYLAGNISGTCMACHGDAK